MIQLTHYHYTINTITLYWCVPATDWSAGAEWPTQTGSTDGECRRMLYRIQSSVSGSRERLLPLKQKVTFWLNWARILTLTPGLLTTRGGFRISVREGGSSCYFKLQNKSEKGTKKNKICNAWRGRNVCEMSDKSDCNSKIKWVSTDRFWAPYHRLYF